MPNPARYIRAGFCLGEYRLDFLLCGTVSACAAISAGRERAGKNICAANICLFLHMKRILPKFCGSFCRVRGKPYVPQSTSDSGNSTFAPAVFFLICRLRQAGRTPLSDFRQVQQIAKVRFVCRRTHMRKSAFLRGSVYKSGFEGVRFIKK